MVHKMRRGLLAGVVLVAAALLMFLLRQCRDQPALPSSLDVIVASRPGCEAPCWLGIVPGVSTEADFVAIAKTHPERFADLKRHAFGDQHVQYFWRDRLIEGLLSLEAASGLVAHVDIYTVHHMSLSSAIAELGAPELYASYLSLGERITVELYLFYPSAGIILLMRIPADQASSVDCRYDLPETAAIERLYLTPMASTQAFLDSLRTLRLTNLRPAPWPGNDGLVLAGCQP